MQESGENEGEPRYALAAGRCAHAFSLALLGSRLSARLFAGRDERTSRIGGLKSLFRRGQSVATIQNGTLLV